MKQVIVMRTDLNMRKGKMVAQGSHASMAALLRDLEQHMYEDGMRMSFYTGIKGSPEQRAVYDWLNGRFTKICVGCSSEDELNEIYEKVLASGIENHALIIDDGATEFNGVATRTCLAVGPALPEEVDKITGHLKLL